MSNRQCFWKVKIKNVGSKQCCVSGSGSSISSESGYGSGSRFLMTKIKGKKLQLKIFIYPWFPRPPLRTSKLKEKPSALKREHPALQKIKFINFFLFLWVIFCPPGSGSGLRNRIQGPQWVRIHNTGRKCTGTNWIFFNFIRILNTCERRTCAHVRSRNVQTGSEEAFLGQLKGEPPRNPLQLHVRVRLQLPYNYQTHQSSNQPYFFIDLWRQSIFQPRAGIF